MIQIQIHQRHPVFLARRLVHRDEFDDLIEYDFEQDQFPWSVYTGSADDLLEAGRRWDGKALLLEGVSSSEGSRSVPGLEEELKRQGLFLGALLGDPHLDNVTRCHGYSRGPIGYCESRRGAV